MVNLFFSYSEGKVMQLTYVTHNPDAPAVFYQCADIVIKK